MSSVQIFYQGTWPILYYNHWTHFPAHRPPSSVLEQAGVTALHSIAAQISYYLGTVPRTAHPLLCDSSASASEFAILT